MATMILAVGQHDEATYVWKNGQLYRLDGKREYHVRDCPTRESLEEFLRYASMKIVEEVEVN